jgi:uncharacterized protein
MGGIGQTVVMSRPPAAARPAPEPFFFGPAGSLFGVLHPAERARARTVGVVLCPAAGHEHLRVHRTFRNIAASLARFGFPVLRFDYSGTGDSAGDGSIATLAGWQADLSAAIEELKRRAGVSRVAVVGLRLGAAIAWQEALRRTDLDLLVMWEPVIDGGRYVEQLRSLELEWLAEPARKGTPDARLAAGQLLGFPFPAQLEQELRSLDLASGPSPASTFVVALFDAAARPEEANWRERLIAAYGTKSIAVLPTGAAWDDPTAIHTAVYAQAALQALPAMFDKVIV